MKQIPVTESALLIRTDFSNDEAWYDLNSVAANPPDPFIFTLEIIDDAEFADFTPEKILDAIPDDYPHSFIVVADSTALNNDDYPLLVIDLLEDRGRQFRSTAAQIASVENNLSIANMGFDDFANAAADTGIFRGFDF
jgi:hypothetical protein